MLKYFFKLNQPFETYEEENFCNHFKTSADLKNVLYKPDSWPQNFKKVKGIKFSNVSFSKKVIEQVTFTDCEFTDCLFIGTTFAKVEFHRCKFLNCNFYKAKIVECYWDPVSVRFDKSYKKNFANLGVDTFQQLMKNADNMDQPDFAMNADIEFRRWKRAQLKYDLEANKFGKLQYASLFAKSFIYEWLCGFGYRPVNFIISTLVVFTLISILNVYLLYLYPLALLHTVPRRSAA